MNRETSRSSKHNCINSDASPYSHFPSVLKRQLWSQKLIIGHQRLKTSQELTSLGTVNEILSTEAKLPGFFPHTCGDRFSISVTEKHMLGHFPLTFDDLETDTARLSDVFMIGGDRSSISLAGKPMAMTLLFTV